MKRNKKYSLLLLTSLAFSAACICINKLVFFFSSKRDQLYQTNSNYIEWRLGKIHYSKNGQGSPIILIHDLDASQSGYEFKALSKKLESKYTVYTIDLLGFGKSDKPKTTYTNFLYVQLINDFITSVVKQKTNILCVGKSTTIGLSLCNYNSTLINKMIFVNAPSIKQLNRVPLKNQAFNKRFLESYLIGTSIFNIKYSQNSLKHSLRKQVFNPSTITKNYILSRNEAVHLGGEASKYTDASICCYYTNQNITHALKAINNSMYFISGNAFLNYEEILSEYSDLNPAIETAVINKSKNLPWIENTQDLYNYISLFLS